MRFLSSYNLISKEDLQRLCVLSARADTHVLTYVTHNSKRLAVAHSRQPQPIRILSQYPSWTCRNPTSRHQPRAGQMLCDASDSCLSLTLSPAQPVWRFLHIYPTADLHFLKETVFARHQNNSSR